MGDEVSAGVQCPSGLVERVILVLAASVDDLLDPPSTLVQGVACQADDVGRILHRGRIRELFSGSGLEAGQPVHRDDLDPAAPRPSGG